jgi:hypothetical protein
MAPFLGLPHALTLLAPPVSVFFGVAKDRSIGCFILQRANKNYTRAMKREDQIEALKINKKHR